MRRIFNLATLLRSIGIGQEPKTPPFNNGLSGIENERLAILSEECGEVVQVIGKIQRHGLLSHHPDSPLTNQALLTQELGDVLGVIELAVKAGLVNESGLQAAKQNKLERITKWLHFK